MKIADPICHNSPPAGPVSEAPSDPAKSKAVENPPAQQESTRAAEQQATERRSDLSLAGQVQQKKMARELDEASKLSATKQSGPKTEAEIRSLYAKTYPALQEGLRQAGLSVNGTSCNVAAGMLKDALVKQGVEGVSIQEGPMHAYVQVKTRDGKTLILDPTASQFFKDGSAIDKKLQAEGFIGTKEDLKKMISNNLENFSFPDKFAVPDQKVFDVFRGANSADLSREEAKEILSPLLDVAERTYFSETKGTLGDAARRQSEWYTEGNLDKPFNDAFGGNIAPRLKRAYEAMEERLSSVDHRVY